MKAGDKARVVHPVIMGTVHMRRFNAQDEVELLLVWTDPATGAEQSRWFVERELEAVQQESET